MKTLTLIALTAFLTLAPGCATETTRVGTSTLDQKYGSMDSKGGMGGMGSTAAPSSNPGGVMQNTGGTALPWKTFKAY